LLLLQTCYSDGFSLAETKTENIVEYINSINDKKAAFTVHIKVFLNSIWFVL
jgi:hypothetical protein